MASVSPVFVKYGGYVVFGLILWILPTSANLPPLFGISCLLGAIFSFGFAAWEGHALSRELNKARLNHRANTEIDHHTIATRTHYAMEAITREVEMQFLPEQVTYQPVQQNALPPGEKVEFDPQTQIYVDQLVDLSKEIGWLTPSVLKRRRKLFRQFSPDDIRVFFSDLASNGVGRVKGTGDNLEWIWQ